jgi:chemotaxis protein methyltransferase CheR
MIPQHSETRSVPRIGPREVAIFARLAQSAGGLFISDQKSDFLVARLGAQLIRLGLPDFAAYASYLETRATEADRTQFIEALTTHTTSFFRENLQYDWLRETGFPDLLTTGAGFRRDLVIWSAASSSGQELYSALMTACSLREAQDTDLRCRGFGTDLSKAILRRAESGVYARDEIGGISDGMRRRFLLSSVDDTNRFRIAADLRQRVRWQQTNLTDAASLPRITADVAMLRNVLIYFDAATRDMVLQNVIRRIARGGYLLTGHSETLTPQAYGLRSIRPSIYQKVE